MRGLIYEEIHSFARENQIELLSSVAKDDGYIVIYEKENEYGIMKFYRDEASDEIRYIKDSIDISNKPNDIMYIQISDSKENYIALFIYNEELRQRSEDIAVEFKDKDSTNNPFMISQTTNQRNPIVISYENQGTVREIKRIIVRDKNYNDIYTQ